MEVGTAGVGSPAKALEEYKNSKRLQIKYIKDVRPNGLFGMKLEIQKEGCFDFEEFSSRSDFLSIDRAKDDVAQQALEARNVRVNKEKSPQEFIQPERNQNLAGLQTVEDTSVKVLEEQFQNLHLVDNETNPSHSSSQKGQLQDTSQIEHDCAAPLDSETLTISCDTPSREQYAGDERCESPPSLNESMEQSACTQMTNDDHEHGESSPNLHEFKEEPLSALATKDGSCESPSAVNEFNKEPMLTQDTVELKEKLLFSEVTKDEHCESSPTLHEFKEEPLSALATKDGSCESSSAVHEFNKEPMFTQDTVELKEKLSFSEATKDEHSESSPTLHEFKEEPLSALATKDGSCESSSAVHEFNKESMFTQVTVELKEKLSFSEVTKDEHSESSPTLHEFKDEPLSALATKDGSCESSSAVHEFNKEPMLTQDTVELKEKLSFSEKFKLRYPLEEKKLGKMLTKAQNYRALINQYFQAIGFKIVFNDCYKETPGFHNGVPGLLCEVKLKMDGTEDGVEFHKPTGIVALRNAELKEQAAKNLWTEFLGYPPLTQVPQESTSSNQNECSSLPAKINVKEWNLSAAPNFKSFLNLYAQKSKANIPNYKFSDAGDECTLNFGGKTYTHKATGGKKKESEEMTAKMASEDILTELGELELMDIIQQKKTSEKMCEGKPNSEVDLNSLKLGQGFKSFLNLYSQKTKGSLPPPHYSHEVTAEGCQYKLEFDGNTYTQFYPIAKKKDVEEALAQQASQQLLDKLGQSERLNEIKVGNAVNTAEVEGVSLFDINSVQIEKMKNSKTFLNLYAQKIKAPKPRYTSQETLQGTEWSLDFEGKHYSKTVFGGKKKQVEELLAQMATEEILTGVDRMDLFELIKPPVELPASFDTTEFCSYKSMLDMYIKKCFQDPNKHPRYVCVPDEEGMRCTLAYGDVTVPNVICTEMNKSAAEEAAAKIGCQQLGLDEIHPNSYKPVEKSPTLSATCYKSLLNLHIQQCFKGKASPGVKYELGEGDPKLCTVTYTIGEGNSKSWTVKFNGNRKDGEEAAAKEACLQEGLPEINLSIHDSPVTNKAESLCLLNTLLQEHSPDIKANSFEMVPSPGHFNQILHLNGKKYESGPQRTIREAKEECAKKALEDLFPDRK